MRSSNFPLPLAFSMAFAFVTMALLPPANATDATVTDIKGTKTRVNEIRAHLHDTCKGFMYYINYPTETDVDSESIIVSVDDDRYRVVIPINIIKNMDQRTRHITGAYPRTMPEWVFTLSDDTSVIGEIKTFTHLKGKAELGDYLIPWQGVQHMEFLSPNATPQVKLKVSSSRAITFYPTENEGRTVTGVRFINYDKNGNGCLLGFKYAAEVDFTTEGGAKYSITLDKFRELRVVKKGDASASVQLISSTGTEFNGQMDAVGVEGVSRFGSFELLLTVPFNLSVKRITIDGK
jgi:hypothetical protein